MPKNTTIEFHRCSRVMSFQKRCSARVGNLTYSTWRVKHAKLLPQPQWFSLSCISLWQVWSCKSPFSRQPYLHTQASASSHSWTYLMWETSMWSNATSPLLSSQSLEWPWLKDLTLFKLVWPSLWLQTAISLWDTRKLQILLNTTHSSSSLRNPGPNKLSIRQIA